MGLDLGLEKAGFNIKVCVEMNKLAAKTIMTNTDIPVINKDINDVSTEEILQTANLKKEEVFLVAGGPPCQAFSTAGARRALEDFRGNVIINYLRVIKEIQPTFFILENVRGILSSAMKYVPEEFGDEYNDIVDIKGSVIYFLVKEFEKYGYSISFTLFNSANYGVPQKRERVIIFGHKGERIPLPNPTHTQSGEETGSKWTSFGQVVSDLKEEDMHFIELSEKPRKYLTLLKGGQYWKHLPENVVEEAMGASYHLGGGKTGFYRRLSVEEPSPTLVTSPSMPATMLAHPEKLRPLSIEEYARIQQFPDHWKFEGHIRDVYKQIGNAVPVGLGYVAGKTILDFYTGNYDKERESKNQIPYSRYKNCSDFEFLPLFEKEIIKHKEKVAVGLVNEYAGNVDSVDKVINLVRDNTLRQQVSAMFTPAFNFIQNLSVKTKATLLNKLNDANDILIVTSLISGLQDATNKNLAVPDNQIIAKIKLTTASGIYLNSLPEGKIKTELVKLVINEKNKINNALNEKEIEAPDLVNEYVGFVDSVEKVVNLVENSTLRQQVSAKFTPAFNAIQNLSGKTKTNLLNKLNNANDIIIVTSLISGLQAATNKNSTNPDNQMIAKIKLTAASGIYLSGLPKGKIKTELNRLVNIEKDKIGLALDKKTELEEQLELFSITT